MNNDISDKLRDQVAAALADKKPLCITAGGSKLFYGNKVDAQAISIAEHKGIIEYQPSELVVTVRSGTLLGDLEAELKANNQMLAFEPPQHGNDTSIGGIIACGLSGPRRVACGSARDFVLGTNIINGKAEKLHFGGQVMKNVAGYDASRLMAGAQGTLGLLLDISLKVLPMNNAETSVKLQTELNTAIIHMQQWIKQGLPITASCYYKNTLYIRIGSTQSAVQQAVDTINKTFNTENIENSIWTEIKNQSHSFFTQNAITESKKLWRCSHQNTTEFYGDIDDQMIEWNGALRWIKSSDSLHSTAAQYHGHATRYPVNTDITETPNNIFQPLQPGLLKIHQRLKQAFDPEHILNPGRLYAEL